MSLFKIYVWVLMTFCGIFSLNSFAQSSNKEQNWIWQYPKPQGNTLHDIYLINKNKAVAVGDYGSVIVTNDAGSSWDVYPHAGGTSLNLNSVHFTDEMHGWAVGKLQEGEANVLLKSTDGGFRWEEVKTKSSIPLYSVWFVDSDTGIAVGKDGFVMRTTNGGVDWDIKKIDNYIKEGTDFNVFFLIKIAFTDKVNGWIVGDGYYGNQIYRTTDCGRTWQWMDHVIVPKYYSEINDICFSGKDKIFAAGGRGGFLKSTDGGVNWTYMNILQKYKNFNQENFYSLCFTDSSNGIITGGDSQSLILRTTDGGMSWSQIDSGKTAERLTKVRFSDKNTGWIVGLSGMILQTTDGGINWMPKREKKRKFRSIYFTDKNVGWAVGDSGLILHTSDGGEKWVSQICNSNLNIYSIIAQNKNTLWAVGGSYNSIAENNRASVLLFSKDGGQNWISKDNIPKTYTYTSVFFQNDTLGWITGTEGALLKTTDKGISWGKKSFNADSTLGKILFVNEKTGWFSYGSKLMKTTDNGNNWYPQPIDSGVIISSFQFINEYKGWIAGNGIYRTTDGGNNWERYTNNFRANYYSIFFSNELTGWAVGYNSMFESVMIKTTDGGKSWSKLNSTAADLLYSIYFINDNTGWAVGNGIIKTVNGGGVLSNTDRNIDCDSKNIPGNLELYQNYPNPFNPTTTIRYAIPKQSLVEVKIYNIMGKEVKSFTMNSQSAGYHNLLWDGRNMNNEQVASGTYIYRLRAVSYEAGEIFEKSAKMLLVK